MLIVVRALRPRLAELMLWAVTMQLMEERTEEAVYVTELVGGETRRSWGPNSPLKHTPTVTRLLPTLTLKAPTSSQIGKPDCHPQLFRGHLLKTKKQR